MNDQTKIVNPDSDRPAGADAAAVFDFAAGGDDAKRNLRDWTPPSVAELAEIMPDFEILGLLGRGGMGAVYRAQQRSLDRAVAIKVLPQELAEDPAFEERFHREAKAMAELNHPNIVQVFDFGRAESGHAYYVMELVDGTDLRRLIQSGHLAEHEALAVVLQVCEALQYAHNQGYVHRDVKPANVFLDKDGKVKIGDFGLAKLVGPSAEAEFSLTRTGVSLGTPGYTAPEQLRRPEEVDHRADIFSLGVLLYEMLTGEVPAGHFPPPSKKVEVDVRLDEVVLRALNSDPKLRYQQVSEVGCAVTNIRENAAVTPPPSPQPGYPAPAPHRQKRSWLPWVVVLLILFMVFLPGLIVVSLMGALWSRSSISPQDSWQRLEPAAPAPVEEVMLNPPPISIQGEVDPNDPGIFELLQDGDGTSSKDIAQRAKLIVATKAAEPETWIEADELFRLLRLKEAGGVNDANEKLEAIRFDKLGIRFGPGSYEQFGFANLLEAQAKAGKNGLFRDVTIRGAGTDKTLLKMRGISPHYSIERLKFQDITIDGDGGGIVDLRGGERSLSVYAYNTRFIGFDEANGGSYLLMAEGPTSFVAEHSDFIGGYGDTKRPSGVRGRVLDISPELQPDRRASYPIVAVFNRCHFSGFDAPRNVTPHAWRLPDADRAQVEFYHCEVDGQPWQLSADGERSTKDLLFVNSKVIPGLKSKADDSIKRLRAGLK